MPSHEEFLPFNADLRREGAVVVARFTGELDMAGAEKARAALAAALAAHAEVVVIDLQGLSYMDSTGLNCLIDAQGKAGRMKVRLAILNGSGPPHRVLELSGMSQVIEMIDDVSELGVPNEDARSV